MLAEHLDLDSRDAGDLVHDLGSVGSLADGRGGHGPNRLGSDFLGEPDLRGDHLGDLRDLVGVDRPIVLRALADPGVGTLSWPSVGSATRTLVVFDPMSIAAQSMRDGDLVRPNGCGPHRAAPRCPGQGVGWGSTTSPGCEASSNSRNSPVTTKATCSPTSTALSPIRSSARATSIIVMAHSRRS